MKRLKGWLSGFLTGLFLAMTPAALVGAAVPFEETPNPDVVTLQTDISYDHLDVTGDGRADSVLVEQGSTGGFFSWEKTNLQIFINGERAFRMEDPYYQGDATASYEVKLCTLNPRDIFFFIRTKSGTGHYNFCRLYRCMNGRFKEVLDLKDTYKDIFHYREYMDVAEVGDTYIQFQWYGQIGVTGALNWTVTYTSGGGSFFRASRICPTAFTDRDQIWTAAREFTAYKTAGLKERAFTVKKGDKVIVTNVYSNSKRLFVKISNTKGQSGWVPCPNDYSPYFKEAVYVV